MAKWRLLFVALVLSASASSAQDAIFVHRYNFSDDLSGWNQKFLDVTQDGDDVRVRFLQLSSADRVCSGLLLQAVEKTVPHTTVRKVAGTNVCANTPRSVKRALAEAERQGIHTETSSQVITAQCGGKARVFSLPFDADIDFEKLKQWDPKVVALNGMIYAVSHRLFGPSFWFYADGQEEAREQLALEMIPVFASGKYDDVLGDDVQVFKKYKRPPPIGQRGPKPVLLDADALHLTRFVAPVYPVIAQSARVQGDVRLRITLDVRTGVVASVEVVRSMPLLDKAAVEAAKDWRFDPAFLDGQPIVVTLRFSLDC